MNDKPTQDNPDLPAQQGRTAWRRHWDRPRPHVALVTAKYKSGRDEKLCTYCLDRRRDLHPRCLAPGCTCNWHTPGALENPPLIPREDPVGSVGLVWRSMKPWIHSRTVRRAFIPEWLDERSSRARRKESRPLMAVYWIKPEDGTAAAASKRKSKPAAVAPLPARAVLPQPAPANSIYRRRQAPYRFQVAKTVRLKAKPSRFGKVIPDLRRAMVFSACAGIAVAALLLGRERLRSYSEPSAVQSTATWPGVALQQQVMTTSIMPNGPVHPDQALPPCPVGSLARRGACWVMFGMEKEMPPDDVKYYCYDLKDAYVLSFDDCIKNRQFFKAKMKETRRSTEPKAGEKP